MYIRFLWFFSLIFMWIGFTELHDLRSIILMILSCSFVALLTSKMISLPNKNYFNLKFIFYFFWLIKEIIISSLIVCKIACRRNLHIKPTLKTIKSIQNSDIGVVLYANSITLTPGTVTLGIDKDKLLVHALDISFAEDLDNQDMDKRIKESFR